MEEPECRINFITNFIAEIGPTLKAELFGILPLIKRWEVRQLCSSNQSLMQFPQRPTNHHQNPGHRVLPPGGPESEKQRNQLNRGDALGVPAQPERPRPV